MWKKILKLGSPRKLVLLACGLSMGWLIYFLSGLNSSTTTIIHPRDHKSPNKPPEEAPIAEQSRCQSVVSYSINLINFYHCI